MDIHTNNFIWHILTRKGVNNIYNAIKTIPGEMIGSNNKYNKYSRHIEMLKYTSSGILRSLLIKCLVFLFSTTKV